MLRGPVSFVVVLAVVACGPPQPGSAPKCTVTSSTLNGTIGGQVTLTASCTGAPASFAWTNCESTASTCTASASAAGPVYYSVVATNAKGTSEPAGVTVTWRTNNPPTCSLTASQLMPTLGASVVLTANCSGGAVDYAWTGCASTASTCVPASPAGAGPVTYSVTATNSSGTSAPASVTLTWLLDLCGPLTDRLEYEMPWNAPQDTSGTNPMHTSERGGMRPGTVVVVRFTVPSSAPSTWTVPQSRVDVAEFQGPPTARHVTLSAHPCDFRAVDATGVNGPLAAAQGTSAALNWTANLATPLTGYTNLAAGRTYYVNVRNSDVAGTMTTCTAATCDALVGFSWPR